MFCMEVLIFCLLNKFLKQPLLYTICLFFFILALIDTSYKFLIIGTSVEQLFDTIFRYIVPSGSFIVAVPYFFIGKCLSENDNDNFRATVLFLFFVLLFGLMVEAFLCRRLYGSEINSVENPRFEHYILLAPFTYYMVRVLLWSKMHIVGNISLLLRRLSILIFLCHQPIIVILYKISNLQMSIFAYFIVCLLSITCSFVIISLSDRFKFLKKLY